MKQTAVKLLEDGINKVLSHLPLEREDIKTLIQQAKEMEKDREIRIKELETFLQEDILDDVYYYHSPIWHRATELLNQTID
jgi:hypothetical protein